jgi:metal-responsive CopG/Arc/MetJ family transcriptional regulator
MAEEKKHRVHEGLVQGYLRPLLKKELEEYVSLRSCSRSEVVAQAIESFLKETKKHNNNPIQRNSV